MNKGSIVERLCSDLIAKSRDINGLLYFTLLYFTVGGCSSWRICLSWLSYALNNSKLSWYNTSQCNHLCGYAQPIQKRSGSQESPFPPSWICIILAFHQSSCVALSTWLYVLKIDALDQWCMRTLFGTKCAALWYETDNQAITPFGYCPSTAFLPVRSHCANNRWNRRQADLQSFALEN